MNAETRQRHCTYCGGDFNCGNCGEAYTRCQCKVYQSMHQHCHKLDKTRSVQALEQQEAS